MNQEDELLAKLLQRAGPRPQPPTDMERRVRAAVHSEWRTQIDGAKRRKTGLWGAGLAAALIAVVGATLLLQSPAPGEVAATVVRVSGAGAASIERRGERIELDAITGTINVGDTLMIGEGSLAMRWGSNGDVRLASGSTLQVTSSKHVRLLAGKLYFDGGDASEMQTKTTFNVETALGLISHVGTQYLAEMRNHSLTLSVREGAATLSDGTTTEALVQSGHQLTASRDGSRNERAIGASDPMWRWTESVVPPLAASERTIHELVGWVGRQTGRSVRYGSADAQRAAQDNRIRGSVDATPLKALEALLQTTDLVYELSDDAIIIRTSEVGAMR